MYKILFYVFRWFKKRPIIVFGMHRSGTSMLARTLTDAGVHMGYLLNNNEESMHFLQLNDKLLQTAGASWDLPKKIDRDYVDYKSVLITMIRHFGNPLKGSFYKGFFKNEWGWKDPRNTFTLSFWIALFPDAKLIHVYRNPIHSSASLMRRNLKMRKEHLQFRREFSDIQNCLILWEKYVSEAIQYDSLENHVAIKYEKLIAGDNETITKLNQLLNIKFDNLIEGRVNPDNNQKNSNNNLDQEVKQTSIVTLARKLGY